MTIIPPEISRVGDMIDAAHEAMTEEPRVHLGCSVVGRHCEREIWLGFRWADREAFPGRIKRLFRRGHREEDTVVADLEAAGLAVTRRQERVTFGGHVSGSIDGVVIGVPEAPKAPHLLEIKTHSRKSFDALADGVARAKPEHVAQMQLYMHGLGLTRALYVAVCKDDDRLHCERVRYDEAAALAALARGTRLSLADRAPPRISDRADWYQCKMCSRHDLCHVRKFTREINCRTCAHSTPTQDGTWVCERWEAAIPEEGQRIGCPSHVVHPDLAPVPWEDIGSPRHAGYGPHINGEPDLPGAMTSEQIVSEWEKERGK